MTELKDDSGVRIKEIHPGIGTIKPASKLFHQASISLHGSAVGWERAILTETGSNSQRAILKEVDRDAWATAEEALIGLACENPRLMGIHINPLNYIRLIFIS